MKALFLLFSMTFVCLQAQAGSHALEEEDHEHARTLSHEEEQEFYFNEMMFNLFGLEMTKAQRFRFPQTKWKECSDEITGNYASANCTNRRGISVILKNFIFSYAYNCIDKGLQAQGLGGQVDELHIQHNGILGDRRHSPRSMHAENRAVDVKAFQMKLRDGRKYKFTYALVKNRPFYKAYRKCWGQVVRQHNGCPLYKGNIMRTGSIGWEDRNHKKHMHMSVPYCVGGKYGDYYYRR